MSTARAVRHQPSMRARPRAGDLSGVYGAEPLQQVYMVKEGVDADWVDALARRMGMPKDKLIGTLGLARATVDRKAREHKRLSSEETSRVLGMARLIGQVESMVAQSGDARGFDAGAWVAAWLEQPLPALDGRLPAELMDTAEGQALVSNLLARMQSGAYA